MLATAIKYGVLLFRDAAPVVYHACRWDDYETADRMLWHLVTSPGSDYTGGDVLKWYPGCEEAVIVR